MMELPHKLLLSRRDIVGPETGITDYMFRKLVAAGTLRPVRPAGLRYARYLKQEVERVCETARAPVLEGR